MKKQVFDMNGNVVKEITLDSKIWNIKPHNQALYDVVVSQMAAQRQGTHKVKTRAEVSGGGRKPWKQKGTGRARQGSIRSPQWKGGGVVFGPTIEKNYEKKVNKKVKKLAIKSALSLKNKENSLYIIDKLELKEPKTKKMIGILEKLNVNNSKLLIITNEINEIVSKSLNNIPKIKNISSTTINVYDLLNSNKLLITESVVKRIQEVYE